MKQGEIQPGKYRLYVNVEPGRIQPGKYRICVNKKGMLIS
jgi:hypothetical protein